MTIEHKTDQNMPRTHDMERRERGVTDMIDLQQALVADHIADLEREGAALRAERAERGHRAETRDHAAAPRELPHASRRVRLGRWLVAFGESISGPSAPEASRAVVDDGPCDDSPGTLSHAA